MIKLKAGVGVVNFERTFWKFSLAPEMNENIFVFLP